MEECEPDKSPIHKFEEYLQEHVTKFLVDEFHMDADETKFANV